MYNYTDTFYYEYEKNSQESKREIKWEEASEIAREATKWETPLRLLEKKA